MTHHLLKDFSRCKINDFNIKLKLQQSKRKWWIWNSLLQTVPECKIKQLISTGQICPTNVKLPLSQDKQARYVATHMEKFCSLFKHIYAHWAVCWLLGKVCQHWLCTCCINLNAYIFGDISDSVPYIQGKDFAKIRRIRVISGIEKDLIS